MDFSHAILRNHVDLVTFASLVVLGLVFCQLIVRSSQVGGSLPRRNVLATLIVALAVVGATFGFSRLYERHQRNVLQGVLSAAAADTKESLESGKPNPEALSRIARRWATAFGSLAQFQIQSLGAGAEPVIVYDVELATKNPISPDGPQKPGDKPAIPASAQTPLEGGLAAFLRLYQGRQYIHTSAPIGTDGNATSVLVLNFRAAPWSTPIAAARLATLLSGLCIVTLLLARPCLHCIHEAELLRRRKVEESLEKAREEADAHSRKKGELLAAMTYEIRTPLTAIMGFSRVLLDTELDPAQRRHVDTIVSAGDRLAGLLNDILDLTKIEEGTLALETIDYGPLAVLTEVIDVMTTQATKKAVNLRLETPLRESFVTSGDATRLRQVVQRIVDNAIKYTDHGAVTVRASWKPPLENQGEGLLQIVVSDTGAGIPPDRLAKLFDSLHVPGKDSHFAGPGLSLVMVKRLVDLMRGQIDVSSSVNSGTTVTVQVPCTPKSTVTQPLADGTPTRPPQSSQRRALVVDDQALNREIVRLMLQRLGYTAETAASGDEALALARTKQYDIVFLDLDMPGLDGFATCTHLRALGGDYRLIPIIAVTGVTEKGTRERCLVAGMSEYLTKPVYAPALKSTIAAVLPADAAPAP